MKSRVIRRITTGNRERESVTKFDLRLHISDVQCKLYFMVGYYNTLTIDLYDTKMRQTNCSKN